MKTAVQQWGNSLALRIPKAFAAQAKFRKGSAVDLKLEKGRLVVTPIAEEPLSLKKLLSKVTRQNVHAETDWGPAQGREIE